MDLQVAVCKGINRDENVAIVREFAYICSYPTGKVSGLTFASITASTICYLPGRTLSLQPEHHSPLLPARCGRQKPGGH